MFTGTDKRKKNCNIQMGFSPLGIRGWWVKKWSQAKRNCVNLYLVKILILAMPSLVEHSISARYGKKI